jgi:1,4-alpha-glucan branching enzyme
MKTAQKESIPTSTSAQKKVRARVTRTLVPPPKNTAPKNWDGDLKIGVEFKLAVAKAHSVAVAGTFNHWDWTKTPLQLTGKFWTGTVDLPRGRYEYRFVVDGRWLSDPTALESVRNPFGESNSVLTI